MSILICDFHGAYDLAASKDRWCLQRILTPSVTALHIASPSSELLKALKIDAYAIAGSQGRNLAVTTQELAQAQDTIVTSDLAHTISELRNLTGVLLLLARDDTRQPGPKVKTDAPVLSIFDLDTAALSLEVENTLLTLHALARATIPRLQQRVSQQKAPMTIQRSKRSLDFPQPPLSGKARQKPFFAVVRESTASTEDSNMRARLMEFSLGEIATATAGSGIQVGWADELFPKLQARAEDSLSHRPKLVIRPVQNGAVRGEDGREDADGGSPTKLWAAWAAQEDLI